LRFIPLIFGIRQLVRLGRSGDSGHDIGERQNLISIASITLSNGADNVGAYIGFFNINLDASVESCNR
jgi:cadmium resistance protein CadD (predicted permease)